MREDGYGDCADLTRLYIDGIAEEMCIGASVCGVDRLCVEDPRCAMWVW